MSVRNVSRAALHIMEEFKNLDDTDSNPDQTHEQFLKSIEDYRNRAAFTRINRSYILDLIELALNFETDNLFKRTIDKNTTDETDITH